MRRIVGMALIMAATVAVTLAQTNGAPEIDAGSATSALALLAGAALIIRGRRRS
jgi:hypothetical protein